MGTKHAQRYCPQCSRTVLAQKQTPTHILHLLLSIVTGGLWLVVWFVLAAVASERSYRCPICGGTTRQAP
ncbi:MULTISPECIES: hypothetical protein [Afifella]|uniref:hypothetical protein n=1 Tax=Afifella TaxID=643217 RepID=UPI000FE43C94|nr:hypothetical protein [Afifella aestuarii]